MKKIISVMSLAILAMTVNFNAVNYASAKTNKEVIIESFDSILTSFNNLKTNKSNELSKTVVKLNKDYDALFTNLGYDSKTIDYLNSLGALKTNFKEELVKDFNKVNTSIENNINAKLLEIANKKNEVNFAYTTINETKKTELDKNISEFKESLKDITEDISTDISRLKSEYEANLSQNSKDLAKALSSVKVDLAKINSFVDSFNNLEKAVNKFRAQYKEFQTNYLSYLGDINQTITSKKKEYKTRIEDVLIKTLDSSIKKYPTLVGYEKEGELRIDEIITTFKSDLTTHLNSTYYIVYSQDDIENILKEYDEMKKIYFDTEGNVKSSKVLTNKNLTTQFENYATKLKKANDAMAKLLDGNTDESLKNIQKEIENNIIEFYNKNAEKYLNSFKDAIQDKLTIRNVENNSIIALNEILELRYVLLVNSFNKETTEQTLKTNVDAFKLYSNQFLKLNSTSLTKKVRQVNARLDLMILKKELAKSKYNKDRKYDDKYTTQFKAYLLSNKKKMTNSEYAEFEEKLLNRMYKLDSDTRFKKYWFMINVIKRIILEERL